MTSRPISAPAYERLSGVDNSFLLVEGPNTPMHIAAIVIFEGGDLLGASGSLDIERIRSYVGSRLHCLPRYRQRLGYVPLENRPMWVDDDHFDLRYHVRHSSLPQPGSERQLRDFCGRILERPLDRARPLWETWFVEGLEGNRFAMITKAHHCMADGIAGVDLLAALMRPTPDADIDPAPEWTPRPVPTDRDVIWAEVVRRGRYAGSVLTDLRSTLGHLDQLAGNVQERVGATWRVLNVGLRSAAETPLNRPIGPHRRIDWLGCDLAEVKAVKNRFGGTINDVVLATVAGALRRFLERRRINVAGLDFRAMIPVNTRTEAENGAGGNHISAWIAALPIDARDPATRLHRVREVTNSLKETKQRLGVETLTHVVEWTSFNFLASSVRLIGRVRSYNLVVTNVPGPPLPFYLLGAPMVAAYPHVPLFDNQGLGLALFSYSGKLFWGFNADWDLVPDLGDLVGDVGASFDELRRAATPIRVARRSGASGRTAPSLPRRRAREA